jgi:phosphatidylglycerol---prolipoprotein diacylglyceryl transferase
MLIHPQIDPVALQLGPVAIHWYGLTYLAAFALFFFLATRRLRHEPFVSITGPGAWARRDIEDMLFLGVMGVVIGGRLGYCLFYKPGYYAAHPLEILYVWQGGMSFHGGLIGVLVSQWWFASTRQRPWLQVMDFIAPCVPLGLASGRVGNFINGELWGRFSSPDLPWGMVFRNSGSMLPRHPSQIYQFLLEGVLLFILLWLYARQPQKTASGTSRPPEASARATGGRALRTGQVSGAFLVGYGVFRFIAEYFREPDSYLGLLALGMSMGQWLCVPMVVAGMVMWFWASKQPFQDQKRPVAQ